MRNNFYFKEKFLNNILCNLPCKLPLNNSHYVTGKNMMFFSKLMCIENELTTLTCHCNNLCNGIKCNFKR